MAGRSGEPVVRLRAVPANSNNPVLFSRIDDPSSLKEPASTDRRITGLCTWRAHKEERRRGFVRLRGGARV